MVRCRYTDWIGSNEHNNWNVTSIRNELSPRDMVLVDIQNNTNTRTVDKRSHLSIEPISFLHMTEMCTLGFSMFTSFQVEWKNPIKIDNIHLQNWLSFHEVIIRIRDISFSLLFSSREHATMLFCLRHSRFHFIPFHSIRLIQFFPTLMRMIKIPRAIYLFIYCYFYFRFFLFSKKEVNSICLAAKIRDLHILYLSIKIVLDLLWYLLNIDIVICVGG